MNTTVLVVRGKMMRFGLVVFSQLFCKFFFYNRLFEVTGQIQLYILVAQNWSKKLN